MRDQVQQAVLTDLRVMLVGPKGHGLSLLRSVLAIAGVPRATMVERADRALELLRVEHFGAVFCEDGLAAGEMSFTVAVRRARAMLDPMIPVFVLHDRARRRDVEAARDLGATDVLTMPISPRTVATKLKSALEAPRPFILAPDFFGPDRRARSREAFAGSDRRVRVPRKSRVDFSHL